MSSSIRNLKFILDENVRVELSQFLKSKGCNTKLALQSTRDSTIASISRKEKRILVTNDEDFSTYAKDEIFSVVWLRIPQNNPQALVSSFEKLLDELKNFKGKLVVLNVGRWKSFPLITKIRV